MRRACLSLVVLWVVSTWAGPTGAQVSSGTPDGGDDEVTALERELAHEDEELSTTDCASACRALGSMQRAADRICALDPGPRCSGARAKVTGARERVRAACPACGIDADREPPTTVTTTGSTADAERVKGGGCAGCAMDGGAGAGAGALGIAWLLAALLGRRRRTQKRANQCAKDAKI